MRISYMQIMNNLMQIGLTVSLAALVPLLLRRVLKKRYPARAVCLVWALLALRLLVPVQLTLPEAPVQVTPRTNYVMQDDRMLFEQAGLPVEQTPARWVTDEQAAALSHANTSQTTTFNLTTVLLGLWLAGVVISAIRQAVSYGMLKRRLDRTAGPAERADLLDVLDSQRSGLGISRKIPLLISPAADCPMLAGFIRPALYLPDENISAADAAFIFRHELTHCRHGDLWLKLLLTAAQCVHWFNPLVYLIVRFAQRILSLRATMRSFADRTQPIAAPTARPSSAPLSRSPDGGRRSFPASETIKRCSCAGLRVCSTSRSKSAAQRSSCSSPCSPPPSAARSPSARKKTLRQLRRARCSWRTPSRRPMWTRMRRNI